jgi:hypothetical protein
MANTHFGRYCFVFAASQSLPGKTARQNEFFCPSHIGTREDTLKVTSLFVVLSILVLGSIAAPARADITVMNPSFETTNALNFSAPTIGQWNTGPIPGWTIAGGVAGSFQPDTVGAGAFSSVPDGVTVAYSNGATISQTLAASLTANTTYLLSVDVGHRLDGFATDYSIALYVGSTLLASLPPGTSNGVIPIGTFADETVTFTSGATVLPGDLRIVLTSDGPQADFDNVRLTASTVPEPSSLSLLAGGLGLLLYARRRR